MTVRRATALVVVIVLAAVAALAGLLVRDGLAARDQLELVRTELGAAQAAAVAADADAFEAAIARASDAADAAVAGTEGPHWSLARAVPRYGVNAEVVQLVATLAESSTALAAAAGGTLADVARAPRELFDAGRVDVDELGAIAAELEALPVEPVEAAVAALEDVDPTHLHPQLAAGRTDALTTAAEAVSTLERARAGASALTGFLGGDGERRYLLAIQNPGELRGTGGLISYVAELRFDDGALGFDTADAEAEDFTQDSITVDAQAALGFSNREPVDRAADFAARYDHVGGGATSQSVNLDPDLPTVAPVLSRLYADRTGEQEPDGVIVLDPVALELLIPATGGPLAVPAPFDEVDGLPDQLTGDNTAQTLLIDVYDAIGGMNSAERGRFDEAITVSVLARLVSGSFPVADFADAIAVAAQERHLQLWSADEQEQRSFELLGVAGALPVATDGVDYLALSAVNAGPDKSDVHVGHAITADVDLSATADRGTFSRRVTATVEVDNPLIAAGRDTYIVGTEEPPPGARRGSDADVRVDNAKNRTWFTWWVPDTTVNRSAREDRGGLPVQQGQIRDHRTLDVFLETPARSANAFTVDWQGPVAVERTADGVAYSLVLWRQGKGIPDLWDVTLTPPAGFTVTQADVVGGGRGTGLGPRGAEPVPLRSSLVDGGVRITGSVTADVRIDVEMVAVDDTGPGAGQ